MKPNIQSDEQLLLTSKLPQFMILIKDGQAVNITQAIDTCLPSLALMAQALQKIKANA
ncbi:MAG: hypothetical protein AVDCRST_MAG56-2370 [uncultured Cytophagales bacterium]|uniref:Uncharacterized protein n=1 Tax=uncultured Cytophagales bacterium TaxID=158755 RepID=A0A6J4H0Q7_9SPHI|nr:MAG: hypothetical protein AVDCRST_MAG56-2370 [uncultured Cytophagales bacterium]